MKFFLDQKIQIILISVVFCFFTLSVFSWDATGHKIIASIAYDQLSSAAKIRVDQLTKLLDRNYPPYQRFLYAAVVADKMRAYGIVSYNDLHFIDYPFSIDQTPTIPPSSHNVVWAINHEIRVLKSPKANNYKKAEALRFLIHFVGDAHQPLHCSNRFSKQFPNGDDGGNLYLIKDSNAANLHELWDQGVGLFRISKQHYPLSTHNVEYLATIIERKFPLADFAGAASNLDVKTWTQQSFNIAKTLVYQTPEGEAPSPEYIRQGQQIVTQQVALAGYRLANLLNQLFGPN